MKTTVTRDDITSYVIACMPNENLDLFDVPAIVQDVIDQLLPDGTVGSVVSHPISLHAWIDETLIENAHNADESFWTIVAKHDLSTVTISTADWVRFREVRNYADAMGISIDIAIIALVNSGLSHESRVYM
jgi:hypothetical protein